MFLTASTVCGATVGPTEDFAAASMRGTGVRMLRARAATVKIMVRGGKGYDAGVTERAGRALMMRGLT